MLAEGGGVVVVGGGRAVSDLGWWADVCAERVLGPCQHTEPQGPLW